LLGAAQFEDLERVLTDLLFVEAKAKYALTFDLVNDYQTALNPGGALEASKKHANMLINLRQYLAFVKQNAFVLHADASLTYQQAANEPDKTLPARKAYQMWLNSASACNNWIEWVNKPQTHAACKMTYNALGEAMLATAVSPDGNVLAMAGKECVIKLFNARTGAELGVIPPSAHGHTQWIVSLNFSPDSRFLVSGSWDNTAKVWDVPTRTLLNTLEGHRRRVNYAAFSPQSGRYVVTASWDNCARVFDLMESGALRKTIREHSRPLNCAVFSPDEKTILTASWDGTMKLIEANVDVSTPHRVLKTFKGHKGSITACAMSPNGLAIASASRDQTVAIWDVVSGKLISSLSSHYKPVLSVAYSWDGQFMATTSADCTIRIFKATLGSETFQIPALEDGVYMTTVCSHPVKANIFATGSSDCNIFIWDSNHPDKKPIAVLEKLHNRPINCLDWSPCGKWIASCSEETSVLLWNGETYKYAGKGAEHLHPVNAVAFNPVTTTPILASACDGFDIRLWNYKTSKPHVPPQTTVTEVMGDPSILKGHESTVKWLSWHHKGKILASASRDRSAKIWDTNTGACIKTLRGHKDWLNSVCFSPDGQKVVTGAWDYHVKQWNLRLPEDEINPPSLSSHDGPVCQARYINHGTHFISAASDGKLVVWDATSSTIITALHGHTSRINATAVLQDGQVVSVSDDGTIRIWAPLEPIEIATLSGHSNTVRSVAFAPSADRYLVYSASDDQTVKVWDSGAAKHAKDDNSTVSRASDEDDHFEPFRPVVQLPLSAHNAQINAVACLKGTDRVATASDDGTAAIWDSHVGSAVRYFAHSSDRAMRAVAIGDSDNYNGMIFTGCDIGIVQCWDERAEAATMSITSVLGNTHNGPVTSISYARSHLWTTGWDNYVRLWDLRNLAKPIVASSSSDWLLSGQFAFDDSLRGLAVGWDGTMWSLEPGMCTRSLHIPVPGTCITDLTNIPFKNHGLVALSSLQGRVTFAECTKSSTFLTARDNLSFQAGAPGTRINKLASYVSKDDIRILYSGSEDSIVRAFLVGTNSSPIPFGSFPCKAPVTALATDPDQRRIWAADRIGHLYLAENRSTN